LKINLFPRNKKGDPAIVILVLLVLLLTGVAIFTFLINPGKVGGSIQDVVVIEGLSFKEDLVRFYVGQAAEKSLSEFGPDLSRGSFEDSFKTQFGNYLFEEKYLIDLKEKIVNSNEQNNNLVIIFPDGSNGLTVTINNVKVTESIGRVQASYEFNLIEEFNIKKI